MVKKERLYYGWIVVGACLMIGAMGIGIRLSFGVFFSSLEADFDWTRAMTSSVFSVYQLFICMFAILGGWTLDRYGPRIALTIMGSLTGLSLLLTSQVSAVWHLFVSYSLLLAMGTGPIYVGIMGLTSRWFTERRGLALGIVSCGAGLGTTFMTPISAYLISNYGWQNSYFILGLMAIFVMVPCGLLLKRAPGEVAASPVSANKPSALEGQDDGIEGFSLLKVIKTKNFWLILSIMFLWSSCLFVVLVHIVRHAIDLGIASIQAATVLSLIGGISLFGRLLMGRVSDSIGRKRASVASALVLAGAMLWLIPASNLWMLYVFAILFGFSFGAVSPLIAALIGDVFGVQHIGILLGVCEVGWAAGAAFGPALAGFLFDTSGNYVLAFLAGAVGMLIAVVLILLVRPLEREVQALPTEQ